jgi:hypothetical protein
MLIEMPMSRCAKIDANRRAVLVEWTHGTDTGQPGRHTPQSGKSTDGGGGAEWRMHGRGIAFAG